MKRILNTEINRSFYLSVTLSLQQMTWVKVSTGIPYTVSRFIGLPLNRLKSLGSPVVKCKNIFFCKYNRLIGILKSNIESIFINVEYCLIGKRKTYFLKYSEFHTFFSIDAVNFRIFLTLLTGIPNTLKTNYSRNIRRRKK